MENINLNAEEHKIACSYCKREMEEMIDNQIHEKEVLLSEISKTPIVYNILQKMRLAGLTRDDLILLIQAKTKIKRDDIRNILDVIEDYENRSQRNIQNALNKT